MSGWTPLPATPPVAGQPGHLADHESIYDAIRELRSEAARNTLTDAAFTWDGLTATARRNDGTGTVISSGSNASTVLNAAIAAVAVGPRGGSVSVFSSAPVIPITAPVRLLDFVGLIGGGAAYTNTIANQVVGNAVLQATGSGMTTANAVIETNGTSAGSGGHTNQGSSIWGLGIDGNNQSMGWHSINANAPQISKGVVVHGAPYGIWFESDIAPNPLPGGGFAAVVDRVVMHGSSGGGLGVAVIKASGQGATDGHIRGCTMHTSQTPIGCDIGGGWEITGSNHLTGTTTTTALVILNGANSICVGNYLDTAKAGNNIIVNQPKCVVVGNYILNGGATSQANACIQLNSAKGVIQGNFLDTSGVGYGIRHSGVGVPAGGIVAMNHSNGVANGAFIDSAGTPVPATSTASTYVAGNTQFAGS